MGITAVLTARARHGGYQRVRDGIGELKGILEKQGLHPRLLRPVTGDHQGDLSLVTEYESWAAFGAASEKVRASSAYQALMKRAAETQDPALESMSTHFYTDIE